MYIFIYEKPNDSDYTEIIDWLVGFYGISIFVGYLRPNSFLYK